MLALASCAVLAGGSAFAETPASWTPVQDNELVLGVGAGPLLVQEPTSPQRGDRTLRVGVETELFVGLMNRATPWLDAELILGLSGLALAGDGFVQVLGGVETQRHGLPGFHLRGTTRFRLGDLGPTLGAGAMVQILAAPAVGSVTRLVLEGGGGFDAFRDADGHLGLELVYGWGLVDDLVSEPGSRLVADVHRVLLRCAWGF